MNDLDIDKFVKQYNEVALIIRNDWCHIAPNSNTIQMMIAMHLDRIATALEEWQKPPQKIITYKYPEDKEEIKKLIKENPGWKENELNL